MGTVVTEKIVYGVKETKAMREAREILVNVDRPVCPKRPGRHQVDRWSPPKFCPKFGSAIEVRTVQESRTQQPAVVLGISLMRKYAREDWGVFSIPEPTADQVQAAQEYLDHPGVTDQPRVYLVLGVS